MKQATSTGITVAKTSLADVLRVLENVRTDEENPHRRSCAAIRRFAELIQSMPEGIPLDIRWIADTFSRILPAHVGLSSKTLSNLKSDLFRGVEASGLSPVLRGIRTPRTPEWCAIERLVESEGPPLHRYMHFRRFVAWCCRKEVTPPDVTQETLDAFAADLVHSPRRHPNTPIRDIARHWNRIVRLGQMPGLSPLVIPDQARRNRRSNLQYLPDSFNEDLERYCRWMARSDPFNESARSKPLAAETITVRRTLIRTVAHIAIEKGVPPAELTRVGVLLRPDIIKSVFIELLARHSNRPNASTEHIRKILKAIAVEWEQADVHQIVELKTLLKKVPSLKPGMTEKNARLLRVFDDHAVLDRMLLLPEQLYNRSLEILDQNRNEALRMLQASIAIELLLTTGLRRSNLANLTWSKHIQCSETSGKPIAIFIPGYEVKNGSEIYQIVGDRLCPMLANYRVLLRSAFHMAPDNLFVRETGNKRSTEGVAKLVMRYLRKYLGVEMTPHQFRHLSAAIFLDNGGDYETLRDHLGHSSSNTTANFYAGRRTRKATSAYNVILDNVRQKMEST